MFVEQPRYTASLNNLLTYLGFTIQSLGLTFAYFFQFKEIYQDCSPLSNNELTFLTKFHLDPWVSSMARLGLGFGNTGLILLAVPPVSSSAR